MSFLQWNPDFSVNVAEIDAEHKMLVQMLNSLHDAMKMGEGKKKVSNILDEMAEYSQKHFHTEEKYMIRFGYPEYEIHKKEHDAFIAKVSGFMEKYKKGDILLSIEVMRFLSDWLTSHIMGSDHKYADFFNKNGLH